MKKSEIIFASRETLAPRLQSLGNSLYVVTDQKVYDLYRGLFDQISKFVFIADDRENAKNISSYEKAINYFIQNRIKRDSHIIAIGGGSVSDLAGFVAHTILRGVSWSVVPTTLLAMVDASIGGKVAINSPYGKNLIGAFHLPEKIIINPSFLNTLDRTEIDSAMGEVVKYSLLSKKIFKVVMKSPSIIEVIRLCSNYKSELVKKDLHDISERRVLNLGHTFGHAFEVKYTIPHGIAILMGLRKILSLYSSPSVNAQFDEMVDKLSLRKYLAIDYPVDDKILDLMGMDKKSESFDSVSLVTIEKIGKVKILKKKWSELNEDISRTKAD